MHKLSHQKTLNILSILPLPKRKFERSVFELPADFPLREKPKFSEGEILRWISADEDTDWGTAIGRFYNYATHQGDWMWCYLILLNPNSKSAAWCQLDTAWEEDLEKFNND